MPKLNKSLTNLKINNECCWVLLRKINNEFHNTNLHNSINSPLSKSFSFQHKVSAQVNLAHHFVGGQHFGYARFEDLAFK